MKLVFMHSYDKLCVIVRDLLKKLDFVFTGIGFGSFAKSLAVGHKRLLTNNLLSAINGY